MSQHYGVVLGMVFDMETQKNDSGALESAWTSEKMKRIIWIILYGTYYMKNIVWIILNDFILFQMFYMDQIKWNILLFNILKLNIYYSRLN